MIDYIIGHAPILSDHPIKARANISDAFRYLACDTPPMSIGAAIKAARKERDITQAELGRAVGVTQSVISEIEAGKLKSWPTHRQAIQRALGKPRSYFEPVESDDVSVTDVRDDLPTMVSVPEYDVRLSAGPGAFNDDEKIVDHWQFSRRYIENELRVAPGNLGVVSVDGDSMYPTLWPGDRVMVDLTETNPAKGGVYALFDSNATVVKRVERVPASDPPEVVLISDNKNHNQYRVNADMVRVIGRVVWFARRM